MGRNCEDMCKVTYRGLYKRKSRKNCKKVCKKNNITRKQNKQRDSPMFHTSPVRSKRFNTCSNKKKAQDKAIKEYETCMLANRSLPKVSDEGFESDTQYESIKKRQSNIRNTDDNVLYESIQTQLSNRRNTDDIGLYELLNKQQPIKPVYKVGPMYVHLNRNKNNKSKKSTLYNRLVPSLVNSNNKRYPHTRKPIIKTNSR